jgi:hypothetical protein
MIYMLKFCISHTSNQHRSWQIDLQYDYQIKKIDLQYNNADFNFNRWIGFFNYTLVYSQRTNISYLPSFENLFSKCHTFWSHFGWLFLSYILQPHDVAALYRKVFFLLFLLQPHAVTKFLKNFIFFFIFVLFCFFVFSKLFFLHFYLNNQFLLKKLFLIEI